MADRGKQRKKEKYKKYNSSLHTERMTQTYFIDMKYSSRVASAVMCRPRLQRRSGLAAVFCECRKKNCKKKVKETKAKHKKQQ